MQPKHPPHSMEAEQSVLGAMLIDPKAIVDCSAILDADDFFNSDHRVIFAGILELAKTCDAIDFVTFSEFLRTRELLEVAGGIQYIGTLAADTPSSANAKAYAEIVRERAQLRALIRIGNQIVEDGYRPDGRKPEEIIQEAEKTLNASRLAGRRGAETDESYATIMARVESQLERASKGEKRHGLHTGFAALDDLTTGLYPGDLIVIGGRPSSGKTSLALNIAEHRALRCNEAVGVFSMEMGQDQLAQRSISSIGRIQAQNIRTGQLTPDEWEKYARVQGMLKEMPLYVDPTRGLSMPELRAKAIRWKMKRGISLIVVDYLQLMGVPGKDRRDIEIGAISKGLKNLAGELGVPVIALSQLNRGLEARENKRPRMSDLRDSGDIEQDADLVLFIYRDEVYNSDSPDKGTAEIIVGKQRCGPTGTVRLAFHAKYNAFDTLDPDWHREKPSGEPAKKRKKGGFTEEELNGRKAS